MTHATVFWELSYCALVWPALTRPWVLLMAIFVHGGIALFLGMPTFGLVMLIGNLAFVSPKTVRKVFDPLRPPPVARRRRQSHKGRGRRLVTVRAALPAHAGVAICPALLGSSNGLPPRTHSPALSARQSKLILNQRP